MGGVCLFIHQLFNLNSKSTRYQSRQIKEIVNKKRHGWFVITEKFKPIKSLTRNFFNLHKKLNLFSIFIKKPIKSLIREVLLNISNKYRCKRWTIFTNRHKPSAKKQKQQQKTRTAQLNTKKRKFRPTYHPISEKLTAIKAERPYC